MMTSAKLAKGAKLGRTDLSAHQTCAALSQPPPAGETTATCQRNLSPHALAPFAALG